MSDMVAWNGATLPLARRRFPNQETQSEMPDFVPVCKVTDVPDPGKEIFEVDGRFVVVFHLDKEWHCLDDQCTHDGGPLGEGEIEGFQIICPRHGARFDIRTGQALTMPAVHATGCHEIKIEGDNVLVRLTQW
ncbi:MAG: Rieske (2Fe-2S) protein [Planctomycetota bacterium]